MATAKKGKPAAKKSGMKPATKQAKKAGRVPSKMPKVKRDPTFVAFVLGQLDRLGGLRSKSMFGGDGLYTRETFFGMVHGGRLYLRVDDSTRPRYEERGMKPFSPAPGMVMKGYYEVPLDLIEDAAGLVGWAREAVAAAPAPVKKVTAKTAAASRRGRRVGT